MPFSRSRQLRCVSRVTAVQAICAILLLNSALSRQNPAEKEPVPNQQSGMSTGSAHAPVKDALSRPITAGGFVDDAPVIFVDMTHTAGIDRFHHRSGGPEKKTILETPGSGVALLDYDNDGWLDIYLLNGSTFPALKGKEAPPRAMLLHNNHDGTFIDVTEKAGVTNERWGFGVAIGDFDNDGWPDIYVRLPTLQKRRVSPLAAGQPAQPGATTTAMVILIYLCRATRSSILITLRSPAKGGFRRDFVSFAGSKSCAVHGACRGRTITCFTTMATARLQT